MNKRNFSILTIIFLSIFLGYQLIELINYSLAPKPVSFDNKIETPEVLDLEAENKPKKSALQNTTIKTIDTPKTKTFQKQNLNNSTQDDAKIEGDKNKPAPKNKFLNVNGVAEEDYRFSKEDYEGQTQKPRATGMMNIEANFAANVLESETVVEKSLENATLKAAQMGHLQTHQFADQKAMERFAIKIELPDSNEGTKFKLQYREPPAAKEIALPQDLQINRPTPAFSVEKTTAPNSPWDNFSGPR